MKNSNKLILGIVALVLAYFGYNKFFTSCNDAACSKDSTVVSVKDSTVDVADSAKNAVVDTTKK